ncbi:hypothetical protein JHW43_004925 [Diplocarpon mali]|nr:hypothetical protein JHW43_004925 [Diplocarpon mali]
MSLTTTDNPATLSLQQTLSNYDLHLTGEDNSDPVEKSAPSSRPGREAGAQNPSSWPQNYYRVPNHRPIDRTLNWAERPTGSNPAEQLFIIVMFAGVSLNAACLAMRLAANGEDRRQSAVGIPVKALLGLVNCYRVRMVKSAFEREISATIPRIALRAASSHTRFE